MKDFLLFGFTKEEAERIVEILYKNKVRELNTVVTQDLADELGCDISLYIYPDEELALVKM